MRSNSKRNRVFNLETQFVMRLRTMVNKMSNFGVIHNKNSSKGFCSLVNALGYVDVSCPNGSSSSPHSNDRRDFFARQRSQRVVTSRTVSVCKPRFRLSITVLWNYENFNKTCCRWIRISRAWPIYHVSGSLYLNGSSVTFSIKRTSTCLYEDRFK